MHFTVDSLMLQRSYPASDDYTSFTPSPRSLFLTAMSRMLITGGAGFIGSHLAERLLADGHHVVLLDDLSTGRLENVQHLLNRPGVELVRDSVENSATVNILTSQCDAVFHLAAAVGVQLVAHEPVRTIRTTIHGTEVILDSAHRF